MNNAQAACASMAFQGWIRSLLAGGLLLLGQALALGQNPSVNLHAPATVCLTAAKQDAPADESPTPDAAEAGETTPSSAPAFGSGEGFGERSWSGPPALGGPKTFWETVWPSLTPYPRTGNFYIAPSGPGSYTLLDLLRGQELRDRPENPYLQWGQNANPFFNVDFRYLDNPNNTETFLGDSLKRIHLGDNWLFSTGGEMRDRYTSLENAYLYNKKPQAGVDESFNLYRARVYGDLNYLDLFRLYAEFTTADSSPQTVPHLSSDVDKGDILNLFVEAKVLPLGDEAVYLRVGRQELLFGSQRLISPSDWSNELRTFQGARALYHNDKIKEDAFLVQPVIVNTGKLDSVDDKQLFTGNFFKYRFSTDISLDAYYLYLENYNQTAAGRNGVLGGYDVNTVGSRFVGQAGEHGQYLWDFEGAIQFGDWSNQTTEADMYSLGVGYWFKDLPCIPTFWVCYDHASGSQDPVNGSEHRTFNALFPSGHNYFNSEDIFGRQNLDDFHLELGLFPTNWMRFTAGYHILNLDQARDALYNSSGSVVRQDTTGKSGTDVGEAVNGSVQFHLDNHQMINISYAHLFSGTYIKDTAVNAAAAKDSDSIWFTYSFKW